jgi:hypothetical protein
MLELDWYIKPCIDFEYQNYILLDYLSKIDSAFAIHNLSPYLLHTEKLIGELEVFRMNMKLFEKEIKRDIIGFSFKNGIIYSEIKTPDKLKEVLEIVEYSKPLLDSKLKLGYKLFEKYPQLLY